jgi:hypothetical protein
MTETTTACVKCGGTIPAEKRSDSRYCSATCKRAREVEVRWITRRLDALRTFQSNGRLMQLPKRQLAAVQAEIEQLEERLGAVADGS